MRENPFTFHHNGEGNYTVRDLNGKALGTVVSTAPVAATGKFVIPGRPELYNHISEAAHVLAAEQKQEVAA
jgi:hypothetical protein